MKFASKAFQQSRSSAAKREPAGTGPAGGGAQPPVAEHPNHAVVEVSGFRVPLIGIPPTAMLQECDCCHDEVPIREIQFTETGCPLCVKCRAGEQ